jgi:hypothetical protein
MQQTQKAMKKCNAMYKNKKGRMGTQVREFCACEVSQKTKENPRLTHTPPQPTQCPSWTKAKN